jgi:hypothetical protein
VSTRAARQIQLILLALFACLSVPSLARSETPLERATRLVKEGVEWARTGSYERAIVLFEEAHALDPEPIVLRFIGQAKERLDDMRGALVSWRAYAERAPDESERARAQRKLIELRAKLPGRLQVKCHVAGARVEIDGRLRGHTPMAVSIEVVPGERMLKVVADGHLPYERRLRVRPDAQIEVPVVLVATRLEPAQGEDRTLTWVLVGAGATALLAGGITAAVVMTHGSGGGGPEGTWTIKTPLEVGR